MKISACYIVKNEEKNIGRSIASLQMAVDEIVVVDTGSVDKTKEIAASFGAKIFDFAWCDDFAAARNFALKQAMGEWIVFLDADEYFSEAAGENIRKAIEDGKNADLLLVSMKNLDRDTGEFQMEFYSPRIFRRQEGLHYVGRIHEELRQNEKLVAKVQRVPKEELLLIHTGYSTSMTNTKAERNLRILLKELSTESYPERLYMYLAESYLGLGEMEQAVYYAKRDIETGRKSVAYASRSYRILLQYFEEKDDKKKRREFVGKAVRDFPELPDFRAELSQCLADELLYADAILAAEKAMALWKDYAGIEPMQLTADMINMLAHRKKVWKMIEEKKDAIRISACLIVKDEIEDFKKWNENADAYAFEKIVVDTGSTDGTAEFAETLGCKVYRMKWQGDFAEARNSALRYATGDWAAMLDADEVFYQPENVCACLSGIDVTCQRADAVLVPIINVDEDDGGREIKRAPYTRLLRLDRKLYYEGRVHEQLKKQDGEVVLFSEKEALAIRHTGYSAGRIQKKLLRNLALLEKEIEEDGRKPHHARYLADCYFGLGRYGEALSFAIEALDGPKSIGAQSDLYRMMLSCMKELDMPKEDQIKLAEKSVELYPELPDFYGKLGILLKDVDRVKAVTNLEKALKLFQQEKKGEEASQFADFIDMVHVTIAKCYIEDGAMKKAEEAVLEALKENPRNEEALDVFCQCRVKEPSTKTAEDLIKIVGGDRENIIYLLRFADSYGWMDLYFSLSEILREKYQSTLHPFLEYQELLQDNSKAGQKIDGMISSVKQLPMVMFALERDKTSRQAEKLLKRCRSLLPAPMNLIWDVYCTGEAEALSEVSDGYRMFLEAVLDFGTDVQADRFISILSHTPDEVKRKMGDFLLEQHQWERAISVYAMLQEDSEKVDAEYWYSFGGAFFGLQNFATAQECMEKVLEYQAGHKGAESYLIWCREAMA